MPLAPVPPGAQVRLRDEDAQHLDDVPKTELAARLRTFTDRLDGLQGALHAEAKRAVLVVLQGRDAAGKDGTIRRVFGPLDPQGLTVTGFKVPSALELSHDYLWRIHRSVPAKGEIGIFNRSHYEDVLVVRVDHLVPETVWRPRYEQINQFERLLTENGVTILKFFLHISPAEQRERLLARLDDPAKYWKFDEGDLRKREQWDAYTEAYEEMLSRTSTAEAPWYIVPADRKPVRNVVVSEVVVSALERLAPRYPGPPGELEKLRAALLR
ncbi:MAG: polyphosphate kinase 2 family protein [Gemmatimonadales bacterium]|nr:polyphosphate kinase 2 family protein [Gemmatimonadales bacterium]